MQVYKVHPLQIELNEVGRLQKYLALDRLQEYLYNHTRISGKQMQHKSICISINTCIGERINL